MSLYVKKVKGELDRKYSVMGILTKVYPTPFEFRRSLIGVCSIRVWRWSRIAAALAVPGIFWLAICEARDIPYEGLMTPGLVWMADHGFFRHDTIKALNPAYEHHAILSERRATETHWRFTNMETVSERERKEFIAVNQTRNERLRKMRESEEAMEKERATKKAQSWW